MIVKINANLFKLEIKEGAKDENKIKTILKIASQTIEVAKDYIDGDDRSRLETDTESKIEMYKEVLGQNYYRVTFVPLLEDDKVVDL